jgi:hypothetical protein
MPRTAVALLLGVLLLGGCLTAPQPLQPTTTVPAADLPRPELRAPTFGEPVVLGLVRGGAEPNIAVAPGIVAVTTPLRLWRSLDDGKSFEEMGEGEVCSLPLGLEAPACPPGFGHRDPGLDGGGDGDIAADAAGNLYWAGLFGTSGPLPFQVSRDKGATWSEPITIAEKDNSTDREWIDARPDGHLYVTWRDFGTQADPADHLLFRASPDGGATWNDTRIITDDHLQGPIVHDPSSAAVYTPYYDTEAGVMLARSADEGTTWELLPLGVAPATASQGSNGGSHIFPVAAVDDAGTVYVVWSVDEPAAAPLNEITFPVVRFAASKDGGHTWSAPRQLSTEGRTAIFPWIAAGAPGRVAVGWYENRNGMPSDAAPDLWDVVLQESTTADAAEPTFLGGPVTAAPIHVGILGTEGPYRFADRTLLDFFEVAIRADGQPILTWVEDGSEPRTVEVHAAGVADGTPLR